MKRINWLDHLISLLVVILGISIAFYLESYKEEKSNKRQEQKYIESLIRDIEIDLSNIDTLKNANRLISKALVKLSNATINANYDKDSLGFWLLNIQYNPPFDAQRTTYESLKSSGKMDLIDDFELRNSVVELYEQHYKDAKQYDQVIDQNLRDFYKPFYFKQIRFTGRFTVNDSFLSSGEFRNIIFAYRFIFLAKTNFYEEVEKEIKLVLDQLRKNYDKSQPY